MTRDIERRWFVLNRPRRDTNGGGETEVTVTSKLQANAERNKEIEKRQKREERERWVLLKRPRCDIDGVGEGK